MNSVQLIGNLTKDPTHKLIGSNETSVCTMRLAVNGRRKQGESWVKKTSYFDVTVFGALADTCAEYLAKGRKVAVVGRLDYQEWKTEDNSTRSKVEVIANEVEFLSPAPQGGGEAPASEPATTAASEEPKPATSRRSRAKEAATA